MKAVLYPHHLAWNCEEMVLYDSLLRLGHTHNDRNLMFLSLVA